MTEKSGIYEIFETDDSQEYEHYAALDIGSNSFHLVISRYVQGALQVLTKVKHKVRLAQGLDEDNNLSQEYIDKGVETLASMSASLSGLPRQKVRVVATHTLRRAHNARDFLQAAKRVFPFPIDIIAGAEEARLIYVGITTGLQHFHPRLIFDIGGGSTEFAIGSGFAPDICKSLSMGCVSYNKRFFNDGIISYKACENAITHARQELELASRTLNKFTWNVVYASSGTAKAIAQVIHPSDNGEPTIAVTKQELQMLLTHCIEKGSAHALDFPGLTDERKPVFVAGLCIMLAVTQSMNIDQVVYTPNALREGVLYELQPAQNTQNICLSTAQSLAKRYHVDTAYAHNVLQSCMNIYKHVKSTWQLDEAPNRFILGWACLLHEVGLHINSKGIQKHSAYILANSDMPGFHQEQQQLIATLVKFHRKRIKVKELPEFVNYDSARVTKLLAILRLALLLNTNRNEAIIPKSIESLNDADLKLHFNSLSMEKNSLLLVDLLKEKNYLQDVNISFHFSVEA